MSEELRAENSGFSRLLELLHGGYLRRGVRSSVAGRLEQVCFEAYSGSCKEDGPRAYCALRACLAIAIDSRNYYL